MVGDAAQWAYHVAYMVAYPVRLDSQLAGQLPQGQQHAG